MSANNNKNNHRLMVLVANMLNSEDPQVKVKEMMDRSAAASNLDAISEETLAYIVAASFNACDVLTQAVDAASIFGMYASMTKVKADNKTFKETAIKNTLAIISPLEMPGVDNLINENTEQYDELDHAAMQELYENTIDSIKNIATDLKSKDFSAQAITEAVVENSDLIEEIFSEFGGSFLELDLATNVDFVKIFGEFMKVVSANTSA